MPRKVRQDLSYFTLDCDIFSSKSSLKPLMRRFKADGLSVYIHILCDVYGTGYYFKPDDYEDYLFELAEDCGITVEKVQLIIAFMADRTLLDAFSLNKNTAFTSHGIQKRYAEAMKGRKRSVAEIKGEYWLLTEDEEAEIDTFYKSQPNANKSEKIDDKSEKIDDKSEIYNTTEQNRNKQKETELKSDDKEVSKKEETNAYARESYEDIFDGCGVTGDYRDAFWAFIQHCNMNKRVPTNDKIYDIIVRLDFAYQNDDSAKAEALKRAVRGGYFDVKENK